MKDIRTPLLIWIYGEFRDDYRLMLQEMDNVLQDFFAVCGSAKKKFAAAANTDRI
ncbi:MAG: hypothetical protein OEV73_06595 [Desulfobulbaceae bacterium]|nr:hypothetical protein [Desulfobulbaceae bacterium]